MIRMHYHAANVRALGPGNRYVLWTQGCPRRCPGCIAPDAQDISGGSLIPVETLVEKIRRHPEAEGLTISGGEPFMQAGALGRLIDRLRAERDMGVIVYTGYTIEELRAIEDQAVKDFIERIDLLIDGPYIESENDDRALRGSANQRAICLTERYRDHLDSYGGDQGRALEYKVTENGFFIVGIPDKLRAEMLGIGRGSGGKV